MGLKHDNPNALPPDAPQTQRMTADESRAVIALWQQERVEQVGLTDQPAVPDVAEGLDIPVEEVQRLLDEVRAQRLEEERRLARERKRAKAELRLVEEEARLTEVQQQRAEVRLAKAERRGQAASGQKGTEDESVPWEVWKATHKPVKWVETKPNTWEDVNQKSPPWLTSAGAKVSGVVICLIWSMAMLFLACLAYLLGFWGPH